MVKKVQQNFAIRKNFAEIKSLLELPNLIDIQRTSWDKFLQSDTEPEKRGNVGRRARVRLDIGIRAAEELLRALLR